MSCTSLLFLAALLGVLACNASMVSLRLTFTNSDCTGDITSSLLETLPPGEACTPVACASGNSKTCSMLYGSYVPYMPFGAGSMSGSLADNVVQQATDEPEAGCSGAPETEEDAMTTAATATATVAVSQRNNVDDGSELFNATSAYSSLDSSASKSDAGSLQVFSVGLVAMTAFFLLA